MMKKAILYDANIWMETAVSLHNQAEKDFDFPLSKNKLNVAHVCTGYAFELIFKVSVSLSGKTPKSKHQTHAAYQDMSSDYRVKFSNIANTHGWKKIGDLFDHIDQSIHHKDRKYWMIPIEGIGKSKSVVFISGKKAIPSLANLHKDISNFVLKEIDKNSFELWE